ncbi:MAG: pyridoxine 5'-phosphate synthase [Myxococcota bacterium]|nr:pyridoxine 5'-phosphate synthase [Myxococcota bacterium]
MRRLGVNIDHVATLREARQVTYPDPVAAASLAELAGADQITCHLRSDRRHIQDADLPRLRDAVQTHLNVEIGATEEMVGIAIEVLGPGHRVTLVPEREGEVTTEGGLNLSDPSIHGAVHEASDRLQDAGIAVSLFVDPELPVIRASALPGVDMIELNTARYAEVPLGQPDEIQRELIRLAKATDLGLELGLEVAAGHGLTHHNLHRLMIHVPAITEFNIGHSIVGRAVFVGLEQAVRDLLEILHR